MATPAVNQSAPLLGATFSRGVGVQFNVWAPKARSVGVRLRTNSKRVVPLESKFQGYFYKFLPDVLPGTRYTFVLNQTLDRPDPASRYQPEGVHGPSEVVDSSYPWQDRRWRGLALPRYVIYELHVGTFSAKGTFEGVIPHLSSLRSLGITALEIMPVGQFPGSRNWGYDGVGLYAVQNTYGGPRGLKKLVNAAHRKGMAVVLDVVYNHLGPEGNFLNDYGPYSTDKYKTPWGGAVNVDDAESDHVRRFFFENARYWFSELHVDALRLDAVDNIMDFSARPFLRELASETRKLSQTLNRPLYLFGESALNDVRLIQKTPRGGLDLDALWNDDFHHSLHVLLTGEKKGYYQDFGETGDLAKAMKEGYVYTGQYSSFRRRRHGGTSKHISSHRFVVSAQNHDQVGNRPAGERMASLVDFERQKLAAAAVCLSDNVPLFFMGEEYGESNPFLYFTSHGDRALVKAIRQGRQWECASFGWKGLVPDPQDEETFRQSKLDHAKLKRVPHRTLWEFYRELLRFRLEYRLGDGRKFWKTSVKVLKQKFVILLERRSGKRRVITAFNFGLKPVSLSFLTRGVRWKKVLDSADSRWKPPEESAKPPDESAKRTPAVSPEGGTPAVSPEGMLKPFSCSVFLGGFS